MSDIVERLRKGTITQPGNQHPTCDDVDVVDALMGEAADEIILLRRQRDDAKADYVRRHKDAVDRYLEVQELRTALSEAESALDEREIASGLTSNGNLWRFWADKAKGLAVKLSEAEQRARREALEAAAKTIEEGFDRGIVSKHDLCAHKKFEWEDCESCAANAVRALIPSEPHDAEGREAPRRGDPSIFDDAEGRN